MQVPGAFRVNIRLERQASLGAAGAPTLPLLALLLLCASRGVRHLFLGSLERFSLDSTFSP